MTKTLTALALVITLNLSAQSKKEHLQENRYDLLTNEFNFPQADFKIIGFGAYHGSVKTETTEMALLQSLTKTGSISYYLPETDFAIAHYFNSYLSSGDTALLKDLVTHYGVRVPQDKTVETYSKWTALKQLNDQLPAEHKLTVVGIDLLVTYKYTCKLLVEVIDRQVVESPALDRVADMLAADTTDYSPYYDSDSKAILRAFVAAYEAAPDDFSKGINDPFIFDHLIRNLKVTFEVFSSKRGETIYDNYVGLSDLYDFKNKPQFARFGFFHLEKDREGEKGNASFFTMLIENGIYAREEVISIIGYLTKSRVLWEVEYDDKGYKTHITEGGFGIGDYRKEYFLGIKNLKKTRISDITLFKLNGQGTPYANGIPDLIEVVMKDEASNGDDVKGKSTTAFIDYAVLISNSKASTPIEKMK
ncbi:hypothetical protein RT717_08335 [Imperialibacter roseus]|uniref:Uncharacterized protein n=1 Tax=Imperialibacter roseus TaxID=1324217 RepID=A0ABZ0IUC4_9BACT|nr:hypothetical protein [Imperialibacter roseus]WOK08643.1 hypothetical protein RT717_08335 [Imperialibacter roseus]